MKIEQAKIEMPVKSNFSFRNTYKIIGIDRISKMILTESINESKLGLSFKTWSDVELWHKVDILI